ncbi:D-lactate dehydratase [Malassezia sp. CBS 17886]|nr:D-lactate dehydratase [Malassezia sp. CBS 17886]
MPLPRRVLISVTSAHAVLSKEAGETGMFVTEALHPFNVFKKAGFEVDLVSETGEYTPDHLSLTKPWITDEELAIYNDHKSEFRSKLDHLNKPADIDASKYGVFFASAGHASLLDYPHAKGLQKIAQKIYEDGGIMSAVCHGGAILPRIMDNYGKSIIAGRQVTGFTTKGEEELGVLQAIKDLQTPTIEESAASAGAVYVAPPNPWAVFTITDERLVTGVNPQSATATAEATVTAFDKHDRA